jgi:cellulose synthase (UDP-forming)
VLRTVSLSIWLFATIAIFTLVFQPVGAEIQLLVSVLTIAFLFIVTRIGGSGPWRYIALATASIIVLRYAYWRTTNTLPPIDDLMSFIPGIMLYIAEMFCIFMFLISVFVVSDPITRKPPVQQDDRNLPTVDVFVPSYNESNSILSLTLATPARNSMSTCSTTAAPTKSATTPTLRLPRRPPGVGVNSRRSAPTWASTT